MVLLGIMLQLQFDILIDSQLCLMEVTGGGGGSKEGRKEGGKKGEGREKGKNAGSCVLLFCGPFI